MGIIYVLLTRPFEDRLHTGSILELNGDLLIMHSRLSDWSKDGSLPLLNKEDVFGGKAHLETDVGRYVYFEILRGHVTCFKF